MTIVEKRGWFWRALGFVVAVCTLGRNRAFLAAYVTTIGSVVGVPVGWDAEAPENRAVIEHEAWHIEQQRRLGLGSVWVGLIPWALFWLCFPLPGGLAWGRYVLERSAYAVGFRDEIGELRAAGADLAAARARRAELIDFGVEQLTGPAYGWAWPFAGAVRRWFEEHV